MFFFFFYNMQIEKTRKASNDDYVFSMLFVFNKLSVQSLDYYIPMFIPTPISVYLQGI